MARIIFLQLNQYEMHGLESLAAVLIAGGHECLLVAPGFETDPMGAISSFSPDLVGIGHTTVERREALLWARAVKKRLGCRVILGGVDPTFFPELALDPNVDAVIRGEAENTLLEFMNRLDRGEDFHDVHGLCFERDNEVVQNPLPPLIPDLDSLPPPRKDIYLERYKYFRKFPIRVFMAGRGCPYSCSYCANKGLRSLYPNPKNYVRFKSPEYLISEIKPVLEKYPGRVIGFADDLFTLKLDWLGEFLPRYKKEIGLPFFCNTRIDAMTGEKAALLKDSGCYTAWYGLESADPKTRELILGRRMTNDDIRRGVEILHSHGILTQSYNMMNIPGESFEQGLATLEFNIELKNDFVVASLFQPFPGTELADRLVAEGKLENPEKLSSRKGISYFAFSPFEQKDANKLVNLQKFFVIGNAYPGLLPIVKKLVALPKNPLFDILFLVSFAIDYGRSHRLSAGEVAYFNFRHVFTTYLARSRFVPPKDSLE